VVVVPVKMPPAPKEMPPAVENTKKERGEGDKSAPAQREEPLPFDARFAKLITEIQEFNKKEFKNPLDAGCHRDLVEALLSGFERLSSATKADESVLRQDVASRFELIGLLQTRFREYVLMKNAMEVGAEKKTSDKPNPKNKVSLEKANQEIKALKQRCEEYQAQGEQVNEALGQTNQANQRLQAKVSELES